MERVFRIGTAHPKTTDHILREVAKNLEDKKVYVAADDLALAVGTILTLNVAVTMPLPWSNCGLGMGPLQHRALTPNVGTVFI